MAELVDLIREAADATEETAANIKAKKIAEVLRWWKAVRDRYDDLDKQRKRILATLENMSNVVIPEMMAEEGVKTITLDDIGIRFTVSQRFSCSMLDKEAGMEWLRNNGLGDLIVETVNAQTLSSAVKKMLEDEGREPPDDLFKQSFMNYTSATKAR